MRKRSLLFLSLLVPAFLVLGGYAALKAQQKTSSTAARSAGPMRPPGPTKRCPAKTPLSPSGGTWTSSSMSLRRRCTV